MIREQLEQATLITLTNANGTQVKISTFGATIVSFMFKDKAGILRDIVLGYDKPSEYLEHRAGHFGATVGRNANRISNAVCTIDGVEYALEANDGTNNLHSGTNGLSHKDWEIDNIDESANSVTLKILSPDLEQGFPGNMTVKVTFTLTEEDAVKIAYEAVSDKDTIANFTNHSYFNLAGHDSGYVGKQKLKLYAKAFTPLTSILVPSGEIRPVKGTPMDFTEFKEIGRDINADDEQLKLAGGYDHNFVLDCNGEEPAIIAEAVCEETGIHLYAYTDCPGVHVYTGNFIENHAGKGGVIYDSRHAFCLETSYFPNAINTPGFKKPLLKAGDTYTSVTIYKLGLD